MNNYRASILVASLLGPRGPSGVQAHFGALARYARARGLQVGIACPHLPPSRARRLALALCRGLLPISREWAILATRRLLRRFLKTQLRRALDAAAEEPPIVYAQDPLSARAALELRREGRQFRLVGVVHYNLSEAHECVLDGNAREGGPLWRDLQENERAVLPQLDTVVFVSRFMARLVRRRIPGLLAGRHEVVPSFVLPPDGDAPPLAAQGDLIAIGTLEPRKNQGFLLEVLAETRRRGYLYRLTLAGDGPHRKTLEAQAAALGLGAQVRFLGFVPAAARLIPQHRVLAHAAQLENLPISLIEALAHGRPILAAAVGGIPEIFRDGQEGRYWPLDDVAAAAQRLIDLLENPPLYERMSEAARRRYQTCYTPAVLGPRWLAAISGSAETGESPYAA